MTEPTDRWTELRLNATEGEWLARPLGDMRRALADLLAERDRLAAALEAIERLHTTSRGDGVATDDGFAPIGRRSSADRGPCSTLPSAPHRAS